MYIFMNCFEYITMFFVVVFFFPNWFYGAYNYQATEHKNIYLE